MSAKTSIAERAAAAMALQSKQPTKGEGDAAAPAPAKTKTTPTRTEDIRLSVAISPKVYHKLVTYTNVLAMQLGLPRIPHVHVIRALLEELDTDKSLQERVGKRVTDSHGTR